VLLSNQPLSSCTFMQQAVQWCYCMRASLEDLCTRRAHLGPVNMTALSLGTCPNLVELKLLGPALQSLDLKCVPLYSRPDGRPRARLPSLRDSAKP